MLPDRSSNAEDPAFQRAFVALSYFLGQRGAALLDPLPARSREAERLATMLGAPERQHRAESLARELQSVTAELDARSFR
jgi:hypothetical protein